MPLKVKKNKTPKKRGRTTMLQKQQVSQNVKVNIYKPSRVPRDYKVKQLGRAGTGGSVPNVRELPSSSFQIVNNQPRPLLYGELFGNARPVSASPFERLLASQAVEDNRQAQVGELRNSLENSRLKAIQRQPILASVRGESEQGRFNARATASMEDNRRPFSVTSVDEQGTLGASFRARIPQTEYLREQLPREREISQYRALSTASSLIHPSTLESVLQDAQSEGLSGQAELPRAESSTFRSDQEGASAEEQLEEASSQSTQQGGADYGHDMVLGQPSIPDRLISYLAQEGTSGDLLQQQREEVVPVTQGAAEEYQVERRGRGAPRREGGTPEEQATRARQRERNARHYARRREGARELFGELGRGVRQGQGSGNLGSTP